MYAPILEGDISAGRAQAVPRLLYGTAFKGAQTASLVTHALEAGFKGIDTAAHTKAYQEKLVGEAVRSILGKGLVRREDIWIQSKYTPYLPTKDASFFPYDVSSDINTQVSTSIAGSLYNFTPSSPSTSTTSTPPPYLDALILHAPYPSLVETLAAYRALESHVPHHTTHLGLSNIDLATLRAVYDASRIKPSIIQNRFTADVAAIPNPKMPPGLDTPEDRYDVGVRSFCREKGIVWQPWGVLWGSPDLLCSRLVETVAGALGVEREIAMYACVQRLEENVSILVGTGREGRMTAAVDGMRKVDEWRRKDSNGEKWDVWMGEFRELLLEEEVER